MLAEIIETIITSVTGFAGGLGEGTVDFFNSIFTQTVGDVTTISNLGIFIMALLGLTIALAIVRWVSSLIRGNR